MSYHSPVLCDVSTNVIVNEFKLPSSDVINFIQWNPDLSFRMYRFLRFIVQFLWSQNKNPTWYRPTLLSFSSIHRPLSGPPTENDQWRFRRIHLLYINMEDAEFNIRTGMETRNAFLKYVPFLANSYRVSNRIWSWVCQNSSWRIYGSLTQV
jgi:hypothetical protein